MKPYQRLAYLRIADVLVDRNLVDAQVIKSALSASAEDGLIFPLVLIESNSITEWELAAIVCETYGLPFVPLDICPPDEGALRGIDLNFLSTNLIVPIVLNDNVLTVVMPGLTPADVLKELEEQCGHNVLPVVGTISGNQTFLRNLMKDHKPGGSEGDAGWGSIFDEGDAAVLLDIEGVVGEVAKVPGKTKVQGLDPATAPVRQIKKDQPVRATTENLPPPPTFGSA